MTGDGAADRAVFLDVSDATVRLALAFACEEAGWRAVRNEDGGTWRVVDHLREASPAPPQGDLLVVAPTALACRRALDAFATGQVRAVVPTWDPAALPRALDLVRAGTSTIPGAVVDQALRFPPLRPRLERVLRLVVRGGTVASMARTLGLSVSSTKRDVAELLHLFDAPNRLALATTAIRLGVPPA